MKMAVFPIKTYRLTYFHRYKGITVYFNLKKQKDQRLILR
jgi:hypothetical protein